MGTGYTEALRWERGRNRTKRKPVWLVYMQAQRRMGNETGKVGKLNHK